MAGPGAGSARRPEPTAVQVATGGPRGGQCPSHGPPPRPGSRRHGPDPASRGRRPGPWEAAGVHGRPLRVVCYASFPLLRSSALRYAPFSHTVKGQEAQQREKGVADAGPPAAGRPLSGCASRRAPPRWTAGGAGTAPVGSEDARSAADRGRAGGGQSGETKKVASAYLSPPAPHPSPPKWRNDAIPHERRNRRAPERYAPATSSTPPARPEAPAPVQYPTCPPPGATNTPGSPRPPSSPTPPPSPHRRRARNRTPRSASTSHNPRARTSSRRARGLSDDLAG